MKTIRIFPLLILLAYTTFGCTSKSAGSNISSNIENEIFPSFADEFIDYKDLKKSLTNPFLVEIESTLYPGDGQDAYSHVCSQTSYLGSDPCCSSNLGGEITTVDYKLRDYYVAFYFIKETVVKGLKNNNYPLRNPQFALRLSSYENDIYSKKISLDSIFRTKSYKTKNDIKLYDDDLMLDYVIRIVDVYTDNTLLCSTFIPIDMYVDLENDSLFIGSYISRYGRNRDSYMPLNLEQYRYQTIINKSRMSNYLLQPYDVKPYQGYSIASMSVEVDDDYYYFCYNDGINEEYQCITVNRPIERIDRVNKKVVKEEKEFKFYKVKKNK